MSDTENNSKTNPFFKIDGYENVLNGLGVSGLDPKQSTKHRAERVLTNVELGEMWRFSGTGSRIIKLPLQDAFREGYQVTGDEDSEISTYLEEKGLWSKFKECARWGDVYGGCIVVLGIKDGGVLADEVNEKDITEISYAHVFDRSQVNIYRIDEDVESENFGEPEMYQVNPLTGSDTFEVHHSRVIRIDGEILPERELKRNHYWHDSVFQSIFREIERAVTSRVSASRALDELYIYVMKMRGLAQQVAQGNESKVVQRLMQMDLTRSSMSMIGIDENESLERNTLTLAGVKDAVEKIDEALSMVTGIPISLLAGQPPKGLGSTDESGMTFYYDKVANKQDEQLTQPLQKLIKYVMLSKDGPTKGKLVDGWKIVWNPIERRSETEIVTNRKMQAETDLIYLDRGVVKNTEVRDSRFGGLEQSLDTDIDASNNPPTAEELAATASKLGDK